MKPQALSFLPIGLGVKVDALFLAWSLCPFPVSSKQTLERQKEELRRSEEKLKSDNLQLCTKMREMIQEFDQEKQEAAERYEKREHFGFVFLLFILKT